MLNDNHHNCAFAEQAVSYLYDEIGAREKGAFERHLKTCELCAGEIAGFGSIRSSMLEWKNEEFQSLEIPKIEIPGKKVEGIYEPIIAQSRAKSRLASWREIFAASPVWATAALASVLVFAGLLLFARDYSVDNETAKVENKVFQQANVLPENENKTELAVRENLPDETNRVSPEKSALSVKAKTIDSQKKNAETVGAANNRIVKTSKGERNAAAKTETIARKSEDPAHKIDASNTVAGITSSVKRRQAPKLSGIEEYDEEATLTLTDLLDEVGGK